MIGRPYRTKKAAKMEKLGGSGRRVREAIRKTRSCVVGEGKWKKRCPVWNGWCLFQKRNVAPPHAELEQLKYYYFKVLLNMPPQPRILASDAKRRLSIIVGQVNSHFFVSAELGHIKVSNFISLQSSVYSGADEPALCILEFGLFFFFFPA